MVTIRALVLAIMLFPVMSSYAQLDSLREGLLKTNFTFSIGFMSNQEKPNLYLNGNLEYFIAHRFSLRSDVYFFLDTEQNSSPLLQKNHAVLLGGLYHLPAKSIDFFIGVQPGLSFTQVRYDQNNESIISKVDLAPVCSIFTGFNYYVNDYFNFYFSIRHLKGKSFVGLPEPFKLNEFRFTGGLGFHFQTRKN